MPKLKITALLDGLHANPTSLDSLKKFHYEWNIILKRLKSVQEALDPIDPQERFIESNHFNLTQTASFTNAIPYNAG